MLKELENTINGDFHCLRLQTSAVYDFQKGHDAQIMMVPYPCFFFSLSYMHKAVVNVRIFPGVEEYGSQSQFQL